MSILVRSARGELIDFDLLRIKQQLSAAPLPKLVQDRQQAIAIKDGNKIIKEPEKQSEVILARELKRK